MRSCGQFLHDVTWPFLEAGRTGMGMFVESYFIFAVGNLNVIWQILYPTCFNDGKSSGQGADDSCNDTVVQTITCR
jgi:hypothetical protein